ncbi:MAG: circularly permuted type 2 ATP-grasp protein, partial [Gammaproteobacteria bacterium]
VVKPANESGGYGMLIGPAASERERRAFAKRIRANPRNYVAQPLISLSTCPTVCPTGIEPRHVDLRPFVLQGARHYVTPGGLTRVALVKGSYVVNSSQGGGSKDTWIVD